MKYFFFCKNFFRVLEKKNIFAKKINGATTVNVMALSLVALSVMYSLHNDCHCHDTGNGDTQYHDDTPHNGILHKGIQRNDTEQSGILHNVVQHTEA
jgi:hypothetical protein